MKFSKLLCLIIALVFTFTVCGEILSFASSATALDAAEDALTLELITHQSHYAVTKNLNLSSSALEAFKKDYGVDISWRTSDTDILTISGSTVSVKRGATDREVTLIATIKSGSSAVEKELTFIVPSKKTFVFESEGFGYPELEGQLVNNIGSRWSRSGNDDYYYATVKNADGEYVMEAYHPKMNSSAQTPTTCLSLSEMPDTDRVTVEFTIECKETVSSELYYDVLFCPNENASPWYDYTDYLHFEKNRNRTILYSRPAGSGTSSALSVSSPYPLGQKARIRMDFSFAEDSYDCYWNGAPVYLDAPLQANDISEIHFNIQRFGSEGRFYLDDIVITAPAGDMEDPITALSSTDVLELITHQSPYGITKSLDLDSPAIKELREDYGVDFSWSTTDTDVLKISGNTVSVTRGEEDREVSLKAVIKSETSSIEKTVTFTVPSKNTFVYESEGFGYPELEGQLINNIGSRWGKSGNDSYYYASLKNRNGSLAMEANLVKQNNSAQTPTTCLSLSDMPDSETLNVEFTLECAEPDTAPTTLHYDVIFCSSDNPRPWYDYITYLDLEKGNRRGIVYHRPAASGTATAINTTIPYPLNTKARIRYEFHFGENPYYDIYWDGAKVTSNAQLLGSTQRLSEIHFNIQRFGQEGRFYVDDLMITAPTGDVKVPTLSPSALGALEVDYSGGYFNVTAEYDDDNFIMYKTGNTTNDNAHFDHHGVWLKNKSNGNSTLLLERAVADETAPPMINGAYLGANHGALGALVTVPNHGLTYKDIGTYWQAGNNGKNWTLVKIVDQNRLQFIGDNWSSGANAFVNEGIIRNNGGAAQSSGTLTNLDGSGQVLNFTAQAGNQQTFPSFTNRKQTVYIVSGGVKEEVTDWSTLNSVRCDRLILDETYDITDPTQMAPRLRTNRPDGGYTVAPDIACGDVVLRYHQTITFMEDGTVLTEFDHEFLKAVNAFEYYGYQYYMKNNYGGGVKRYVPDTKAFTANAASYTGRDSFTAGAAKTFDFSVPHQVISGSYFDYPQNARPDKTYWANSSKAPNRVVDYMINSDGSTQMAFANGYLPLYDGENDVRSQMTSQTFFYYGSVKAYPIFIKSGTLSAGTRIHGVSYKKHDNTAESSEKVQAYSVLYGDDIYYYIDVLENSENVSVKLPESFDTSSAMCIDMTGAPEYRISGNTVTVSGNKKDYIVLKAKAVSGDGAVINKTFYNVVNGNLQADIANSGSEALEGTAIAVCYDKNGKMLTAQTVPVEISGKDTEIVTFDENFSQGSYCKVFLFGKNNASPLCRNGYSAIN